MAFFGGTTWYVATTGNDSGAGTLVDPFLTIQRALISVNGGDTILVQDGVYYPPDPTIDAMLVDISVGGVPQRPITIQAANSQGAILDGNGTALACVNFNSGSGWVNVSGFEMRNTRWAGVWANSGAASHCAVTDFNIHHIGNRFEASSAGMAGIYADTSAILVVSNGRFAHIGRTNDAGGCFDHGMYYHGQVDVSYSIFCDAITGWHIQCAAGASGVVLGNMFFGPNQYTGTGSPKPGQVMLWNAEGATTFDSNIFYDPHTAALTSLSYSGSLLLQNNTVHTDSGATLQDFVGGTVVGTTLSSLASYTGPMPCGTAGVGTAGPGSVGGIPNPPSGPPIAPGGGQGGIGNPIPPPPPVPTPVPGAGGGGGVIIYPGGVGSPPRGLGGPPVGVGIFVPGVPGNLQFPTLASGACYVQSPLSEQPLAKYPVQMSGAWVTRTIRFVNDTEQAWVVRPRLTSFVLQYRRVHGYDVGRVLEFFNARHGKYVDIALLNTFTITIGASVALPTSPYSVALNAAAMANVAWPNITLDVWVFLWESITSTTLTGTQVNDLLAALNISAGLRSITFVTQSQFVTAIVLYLATSADALWPNIDVDVWSFYWDSVTGTPLTPAQVDGVLLTLGIPASQRGTTFVSEYNFIRALVYSKVTYNWCVFDQDSIELTADAESPNYFSFVVRIKQVRPN